MVDVPGRAKVRQILADILKRPVLDVQESKKRIFVGEKVIFLESTCEGGKSKQSCDTFGFEHHAKHESPQ